MVGVWVLVVDVGVHGGCVGAHGGCVGGGSGRGCTCWVCGH